jgi:hypothetical protein
LCTKDGSCGLGNGLGPKARDIRPKTCSYRANVSGISSLQETKYLLREQFVVMSGTWE